MTCFRFLLVATRHGTSPEAPGCSVLFYVILHAVFVAMSALRYEIPQKSVHSAQVQCARGQQSRTLTNLRTRRLRLHMGVSQWLQYQSIPRVHSLGDLEGTAGSLTHHQRHCASEPVTDSSEQSVSRGPQVRRSPCRSRALQSLSSNAVRL